MGAAGLLLALAFLPGPAGAQDGSTLELADLLEVARDRSPRLQAARLLVDASAAREPAAGLLPDPSFQVGVMNLALPDFSPDMPASMAPVFQAMQRIPLGGKLGLRGDIAEQSTRIEEAAKEEAWWALRTEVASVFYEIYRLDRQMEVAQETMDLLSNFQSVAQAMYSAGSGRQSDVLRSSVEVARAEAEVERLSALRRGQAAKLNGIINEATDTPVLPPTLGRLPQTVPALNTLLDLAQEHRPALEVMRVALERAGSNLELARKDIWPDLTIGVQYGLGRMEGDVRSMGGASVGFSVPVFAGKRQRKAAEEAVVLESVARSRFDEVLAMVNAEVVSVVADLDRSRTLLRLYREEILPQARAGVASSLSAYRVGSVDFSTLVDAQLAVNRFDSEYFGLLAAYGASLAKLETTIGHGLPVTGPLISEER